MHNQHPGSLELIQYLRKSPDRSATNVILSHAIRTKRAPRNICGALSVKVTVFIDLLLMASESCLLNQDPVIPIVAVMRFKPLRVFRFKDTV